MDLKHILIEIVKNESNIMDALKTVRSLSLPQGCITAGFIRNLVWDMKHGYEHPTRSNDVDVLYYDPANIKKETNRNFENLLRKMNPTIPWEVKNQARMHIKNHDHPYKSVADAMKHWAETATAVGVRIEKDDSISVIAPFGLEDLFGLVLRRGPNVSDQSAFRRRYTEKGWLKKWPKLKVIE